MLPVLVKEKKMDATGTNSRRVATTPNLFHDQFNPLTSGSRGSMNIGSSFQCLFPSLTQGRKINSPYCDYGEDIKCINISRVRGQIMLFGSGSTAGYALA